MTALPGPEDVRPAWIYLHLAADGSLLYIGKTLSMRYRQRMHAKDSAWWPLVAEVDSFGPMPHHDAWTAETALIATHQPPHNVMGTDREAEMHMRRGASKHWNRVALSALQAEGVTFPSNAAVRARAALLLGEGVAA